MEKIEAAAINLAGMTYLRPAPARHNDVINELVRLGLSYEADGRQGFWTSENRFVDRKEALRIAVDAGQMKNVPHPSGDLFSEDLW